MSQTPNSSVPNSKSVPAQTGNVTPDAHQPPDDTERTYYEGRPLLRGEIFRCFIFWTIALVCLLFPFFWKMMDGRFPGGVWWLLGLLFAILFATIPIIDTRKTRYRITNYRIDFERGILSRSIDTLELWHVEDIKLHQSVIDRIFKVGTITVFSNDDTNPELDIEGIPDPRPLFEMLKQRIIAVKRQRGVLKVDTGH